MAFTPASSIGGGGAGGNVFVTNFPAIQPVSGTVAVTQSTSPWVVDGSAVTQPVSGPLTDAQLRAAAVPVDASGFAVPITAAALPLPAGAATEATLAALEAEAATEATLATLATEETLAAGNDATAELGWYALRADERAETWQK